MIDEVSSIFWGLSLAFNIILVLIGLPLCLLICCCCRKHQGAIEKDLKTLARNHNLLQSGNEEIQEEPIQQQQLAKRRKVILKSLPEKSQQPIQVTEPDLSVPDLQNYELEE